MVAEQALSLIPGTHTKEESVSESCPLTSLYAYAHAFSFRRTKTSKCVFDAHLQEDQDLNEVVLSPLWAGFNGRSPQKEISGSLKLICTSGRIPAAFSSPSLRQQKQQGSLVTRAHSALLRQRKPRDGLLFHTCPSTPSFFILHRSSPPKVCSCTT